MYYIIKDKEKEGQKFKIMAVKTQDEKSFLGLYESEIVASGESMQEVLIKFGALQKGD